ncbi:MAG TPA: GNAT family protein [Nocardioides sp.]|nr:GNAT family protein [Nocardioides sp.]
MEWPFFALRIVSGKVLLRGVTDGDLDPLVAALPGDLELDPHLERFAPLPEVRDRERRLVAGLWRHRGLWSPSSWCLDLVVEHAGRVVGIQSLEGDDFPTLRTVDSASWLEPGMRGRGLGTAMRAGIMALAFGHLGADAAVSSAEHSNAASLAVSRRLGYVDNGVGRVHGAQGAVDLQYLRLSRESWRASGFTAEVTGVERCLPWFGLGPEVGPEVG